MEHTKDTELEPMTMAEPSVAQRSDAIHRDLARHVAEQFRRSAVPLTIATVGIAFLLRDEIDSLPLLIWMCVGLAYVAVGLYVNRVDFERIDAPGVDAKFLVRTVPTHAAFGLVWGSLSLVAAIWGTDQAMLTTMIVIAGVTSLTMVVLAPFRVLFVSALVGLIVPLLIGIVISSGIGASFIVLVLLYAAVTLLLHDVLHRSVTGAVQAKHENGALAAQLTSFLTERDPLTGLLNRTGFLGELRQFALRSSLQDSQILVVVANVERLASVNELFGVRAGDDLLVDVGKRIDSALPSTVATARLGGDEFAAAVLVVDHDSAGMMAQLIGVLNAPYSVTEVPLDVTFHVAHSLGPVHECDALLASSTTSLRRSRISYRSTFSMGGISTQDKRDMVDQLRSGLENGEITPWFQPIVETRTGDLVSFEALVRWVHPTRGVLAPDSFLPLAAATGMLPLLTNVVINESLRFVRLKLDHDPGSDLAVHVNVLPSDLRRPTLVSDIAEALKVSGVASKHLVLEITEHDVLLLDDALVDNMHAMHDLGVHLAIDDFGTGYSSLSHLLELPIEHIKIDRTFIRQLTDHGQSEPLVRGVIGLASALGVVTVAEGVEEVGQAQRLGALGCTNIQGYLVSKPLPLAQAIGFTTSIHPSVLT
jgi:diguanylate cyclase (GGDEF)-like protein